jgi:hypothetical protein
MELPTLPTNPQPIDYEIEKFVEWENDNTKSRYRFLDFMGLRIREVSKKNIKWGAANVEINLLFEDLRPQFQALSDALAAKPIEVEPLVWPQPTFGEGYFDVEKELDRYIAFWRPEGGESAWSVECESVQEAKMVCQEKCLEWLSAQLGRPVVVKGVK